MQKDRLIAVIPARWQSSRFPGKPLAQILGKSLIRRTYENAQRCTCLDRIVIATDDQRIVDHAKEFDAEVFMTSKECPTGTNRVGELIKRHFTDAEIVVNIQGDEPCLDPAVVDKLVNTLRQTPGAVMTTAATKMIKRADIVNPSIVKCVFDNNGKILYFSRSPIPFLKNQAIACDYYRHIGVYGFRTSFLLRFLQLQPTKLQEVEDLEQLKVLESGFPIHGCVVDGVAHGVDTPEDIKRIEKILCRVNTSSLQEELSPL